MPVIDQNTGRPFPLGARKAPRYKLLAAVPFRARAETPPQAAYVPARLDMWGNNQYGDCVTAEEAFAKATYQPEIFIDTQTVIDWARRHNVLDGATLTEVLDAFKAGDGFAVGPQRYNDGPYSGVDYSNESVLQGAIAQGPVKIAIDHTPLPQGAGNQSGWYAVGGHHGQYQNTDHCVAICGYGPAAWLYQQLNVPLPAALAGKSGYLLFTWGTIGFVDYDWIMSTCAEAWVRNPTTVGVPPLGPTPPPGPNPPPGPGPDVHPTLNISLTGTVGGMFGGHPVTMTGTAVPQSQFHALKSDPSLAYADAAMLAINWSAIPGDVMRLVHDVTSRNYADIQPAIAQLRADLGLAATARGYVAGPLSGVHWGALLRDLGKIGFAIEAKDYGAILALIPQLLSDLGITTQNAAATTTATANGNWVVTADWVNVEQQGGDSSDWFNRPDRNR